MLGMEWLEGLNAPVFAHEELFALIGERFMAVLSHRDRCRSSSGAKKESPEQNLHIIESL